MNKLTLSVFVLLTIPSMIVAPKNVMAQSQKKQALEVEAGDASIVDASLGKAKNVHRLKDLFFSGQFTPKDIEEIKAAKIERVITLRTDGEIDWNEKSAIESAGLEFEQVPFRGPESLTDDVFDKVRGLLSDESQPTLLHCGSANRVAGVWLTYRVLDEGVELDTAIAEAKAIGLRSPLIEEKAVGYIKRQRLNHGATGADAETSSSDK